MGNKLACFKEKERDIAIEGALSRDASAIKDPRKRQTSKMVKSQVHFTLLPVWRNHNPHRPSLTLHTSPALLFPSNTWSMLHTNVFLSLNHLNHTSTPPQGASAPQSIELAEAVEKRKAAEKALLNYAEQGSVAGVKAALKEGADPRLAQDWARSLHLDDTVMTVGLWSGLGLAVQVRVIVRVRVQARVRITLYTGML